MATPTTKTEVLKILEKELIKQYQTLDAQFRPQLLYTAPHWAKDGDPCVVVEFIYEDLVSTTLKGKKDGYAVWDEAWVDGDFTVVDVKISKTEQILTLENELTKQYQEVDGQNRPLKIYEVGVFARTGTPCKVTEYVYQNPTSSTIKGKKESYATWDETWVPDTLFTVNY